MVRISDARMSGTAFGTIVLHVTPEAALGGPLALVKNGDRIRLSVEQCRIDLLIDTAEMETRKNELTSQKQVVKKQRGYDQLYAEQVLQADKGCDFNFLTAIETEKIKPASDV